MVQCLGFLGGHMPLDRLGVSGSQKRGRLFGASHVVFPVYLDRL